MFCSRNTSEADDPRAYGEGVVTARSPVTPGESGQWDICPEIECRAKEFGTSRDSHICTLFFFYSEMVLSLFFVSKELTSE